MPRWTRHQTLLAIAATLVMAVAFVFHTYPIGLGDVYWHLASGRWIVDHGVLPSTDPFTYTLTDAPDARQQLILQGFWLSQVLFYGVYTAFGVWGLIVLKSALLVALYALVWRALVNAGVEGWFALLVVVPLPLLLNRYDELRPQLFSFLGTVIVFVLLTQARAALRQSATVPRALLALPLVMMLWANLHRGFILGWVVILSIAAGELWRRWRHHDALEGAALRRFLAGCALAMLASLLNPNFADAFLVDLSELQGPFARVIDEYLSLWNYAAFVQQPMLFYGVSAVAVLTAATLAWRWRAADPAHLFLLLGFGAAGFRTFRFTILFVLMALIIGVPHLAALFGNVITRMTGLVRIAVVGAMLATAYVAVQRTAFWHGPIETAYVPEHAARFIQDHNPPTPLFNAYSYGGYLEWMLAPRYRMFVDPRCLDFAVYDAYQNARDGRAQDVLDRYGVNSVVFHVVTPVVDDIPEIVLNLLLDPQWTLVYADTLSVILVRAAVNTLPAIDKNGVWNFLLRISEQKLSARPGDAQAALQLARVQLYHGNVTEAQRLLASILRSEPQNHSALRYWNAIQKAVAGSQ